MPTDPARLLALAIWYGPYAIELLVLAALARYFYRNGGREPAVSRFRTLSRAFGSLARRRTMAILFTGVTALAARALLASDFENQLLAVQRANQRVLNERQFAFKLDVNHGAKDLRHAPDIVARHTRLLLRARIRWLRRQK